MSLFTFVVFFLVYIFFVTPIIHDHVMHSKSEMLKSGTEQALSNISRFYELQNGSAKADIQDGILEYLKVFGFGSGSKYRLFVLDGNLEPVIDKQTGRSDDPGLGNELKYYFLEYGITGANKVDRSGIWRPDYGRIWRDISKGHRIFAFSYFAPMDIIIGSYMYPEEAGRDSWNVVLAVGAVSAVLILILLFFLNFHLELAERRKITNAIVENRITNAEVKYFMFFDSMYDMVFLQKGDPDRFIRSPFAYVNDSAVKNLGYSRQELFAMDLVWISTRDEESATGKKSMQEDFVSLLKEKGRHMIFENNFKAKNGEVIPVEISAFTLDFGGEHYVVSMARNVGERKITEKKQNRLIGQLMEANFELEKFAYVAAHDLRDPIRSVSYALEMLESECGSAMPARAAELIKLASDNSEKMYYMVKGLLDYSRINRAFMKNEVVDLNGVLDQALTNLEMSIRENGAVIKRENLPDIKGVPQHFVMLFQNLIGNAIKFHRADSVPEIEIGGSEGRQENYFFVKDNGIGMEKEYFEKIFGIFERLQAGPEFEGTGIGLAICKRVIDIYGGKIWVKSEPGKGSTFFMTIPEGGLK